MISIFYVILFAEFFSQISSILSFLGGIEANLRSPCFLIIVSFIWLESVSSLANQDIIVFSFRALPPKVIPSLWDSSSLSLDLFCSYYWFKLSLWFCNSCCLTPFDILSDLWFYCLQKLCVYFNFVLLFLVILIIWFFSAEGFWLIKTNLSFIGVSMRFISRR